jgi:hypothetical protein
MPLGLYNRRFATPNGINGGETNGEEDQIILTAQYRDTIIDDVGFVKRKTINLQVRRIRICQMHYLLILHCN